MTVSILTEAYPIMSGSTIVHHPITYMKKCNTKRLHNIYPHFKPFLFTSTKNDGFSFDSPKNLPNL